jgi:hypothetical protein
VLVCSARLGAELATRHDVRPVLVRQPRPPRVAGEPAGFPARDPDPRGHVKIGFLGSVDHARFLEDVLAAPLETLRRELGDRLALIFCGAVPPFASALGATCHPFEPDFATWRRRACGLALDVGLAPLPDTPFHRYKYFNKYLEYGSLGIAGVYSDVPPSADVVQDGVTGLLCANTPDAWLAALRRLAGDPSLRERVARTAWDDSERHWSSAALADAWTAALAPLLAHRAPAIDATQVRVRSGSLQHALDRLQVYGPLRFAERVAGRLSGRLRPG